MWRCGDVPALADSSQETLTLARQLLAASEALQHLRDEVRMRIVLGQSPCANGCGVARTTICSEFWKPLGSELERAVDLRRKFIERPVTVPEGAEADDLFMEAVDNLAHGKSALVSGDCSVWLSQRKWLEAVKVLGERPSDANSWMHVSEHLKLLRRLKELALRLECPCRRVAYRAGA